MSFLDDVHGQRAYQDQVWGGPAHDDRLDNETWLAVLMKQAGHAADTILRTQEKVRDITDTRFELVQLAAVALAWGEALDRKIEHAKSDRARRT